jgi:hypothetical protein
MKKLILIILCIFLSVFNGTSQCNNGTNYYPSTIFTPTDNTWGSATSWNYAGEVIRVNIISGDDYEFSTCSGYGGVNASYDTQLTLIDESGVVVGFNDDFTGCSGYTSYIKWTATYTGVLYVHLNQYNCASNSTSTEVMIYKTPAPTGGGGGTTNPNEVTIGDPNSALDDGRVPTYGYYEYSWSAALYTANELGNVPLNIEKISWNVTNGNAATMTNQEIWMAMSIDEVFLDGTMPEDGVGPWTDWKKVYDGTIDFTPGWNEIPLQGLYGYDGVKNLLVKVVNNHGSWTSSYPEFQYTTKSNSVVYNYDDGVFPGPVGYTNSIRPNTMFGFQGSGTALPIDLVSFTGEMIDNNVELEWVVASQVNNEYFKIEKSLNCEQWEEVSRIPGAGNSNTQMNYKIYDEKPYDGISYYRLSQTDYDGESETFSPISIIYNKPITLSINPNPVKEILHLYLEETLRGSTNLTIFNTKGQKIYKKSFIGDYKIIHLNVNDFKKGYYLLEIDHNQRKGNLKFLKK